MHMQSRSFAQIGRLLLWLLLVGLSWYEIRGDESSVFHALNLVFHEAGHFICAIGGELIGFMGGTIGQLAIPIIVGIQFTRQRDWYATSVAVWWAGANLLDIGTYMADARAQALPLLGGEHDWAYLFGRFGLLNQDTLIGRAVWELGLILMIGALAAALWRIAMPSREVQ
jgi:hypothetical protein